MLLDRIGSTWVVSEFSVRECFLCCYSSLFNNLWPMQAHAINIPMPHLLSLPTCTLKNTTFDSVPSLHSAGSGLRSLWHFDSSHRAVPTGVVVWRLQPLSLQLMILAQNDSQSLAWKLQCNFHTCFEINNCMLDVDKRIGVSVSRIRLHGRQLVVWCSTVKGVLRNVSY